MAAGWGSLLLALAAAEPAGTAWYAVTADGGAAIGYATSAVVSRPDGRELIETQTIEVRGTAGTPQPVTQRTVIRQDRAGRTTSITVDGGVGGNRTHTVARINGRRAEVTRQTRADRRTATVDLPPGVRFDDGEALLTSWDRAVTPSLAFDNFDIDALGAEHVTIEPAARQPDDPPGATAALRRRYDAGRFRGLSRLTLDASGEVIAVTQPLFGAAITTRRATREDALKPHAPYDALQNVTTKSPFRISGPASRGHIRYHFGFRDGLTFDLPQTPEQRVAVGPSGVTVDICVECGPGLPADPRTLAAALKPNAWMQSDSPLLRKLADPVTKLKVSDRKKMELLAEIARPKLERLDFAGHYSALETLQRRSGDCTEASVLLAALGRSAGIPTLVVNGLVYARAYYHGVSNAFMPHSWTLAYVDGHWKSFDMALDGFEATHIALTIGDGDARALTASGQLAGLLIWQDMAEVRTLPAP